MPGHHSVQIANHHFQMKSQGRSKVWYPKFGLPRKASLIPTPLGEASVTVLVIVALSSLVI